MRTALRRIGRDLLDRRHLDAYAVAVLALAFAVLSIVGGDIPDDLRWAAALAGIGLLVYRVTVPDATGSASRLLGDRSDLEATPLATRLSDAREVWLFAPSGVNFLTMPNLDRLRTTALVRSDGTVRIVVLDPSNPVAVELATRQLDNSLDYPLQEFAQCLGTVIRQLQAMSGWEVAGSFDYRLLQYNPGFSLVALNPSQRDGVVIVEFHGFHNESTLTRQHLELRRQEDEQSYSYWIRQFEYIWKAATPP